MDWVQCNSCQKRPKQVRMFVTSCGHISCEECRKKVENSCLIYDAEEHTLNMSHPQLVTSTPIVNLEVSRKEYLRKAFFSGGQNPSPVL
ncbi:unnamed protein product [Caenorhabditis bovis]|uniref:RING-type domain-containing protein n=1 Tax=Caenorhabditis bovis TaxID=2654633 RepID=A0A8S1EMT1_9PELO|nr:unnamed protein product [Caenorhabditis bovis]